MTSAAELSRAVREVEWYHTLELAPDLITPGWFDTRSVVPLIPFPVSLTGQRCLDVGTFDGFWAFEMERRGASEVVAVDLLDPRQWDWPNNSPESVVAAIGARKGRGEGFLVSREALGSNVERVERSVYDVDPDTLGVFDFVYVGSLLLHLRDPIAALQRLHAVCRGQLLLVDAIDPVLTVLHRRHPTASLDGNQRPWWWKPNLAALARMVESAGFTLSQPPGRVRMPAGDGQPRPKVSRRLLSDRSYREAFLLRRRGDAHGVILATPSGR